MLEKNPFHSFWMGGYECTDQLNAFGKRVDFLNVTGHLQMLQKDYELLKPYNIRTVREGIRWSQVETIPYQYNWSTVETMIKCGKASGIQQVWDICHFGFPDDLTPLHPQFARRFASVCRSFVQFYRSLNPEGELIITPINEVSFLSWLGGDARGTSPYCVRQGWEVKYGLMRAYIEGVAALKEMDSSIKILTTEPLVNMVPPVNATRQQIEDSAYAHEFQYQSVDMLTGNICAELGGSPEYLDILGLNFYYNNQWIVGSHEFLPWVNLPYDPRWKPLRSLLLQAYNRYNVPLVLTETSHSGIHRSNWIEYITVECASLVQQNIPLFGVCLYPIIDRPDWDHFHPWHNAGLWDAIIKTDGPPERSLYQPYAEALLKAQASINNAQKNQRCNKIESHSNALVV